MLEEKIAELKEARKKLEIAVTFTSEKKEMIEATDLWKEYTEVRASLTEAQVVVSVLEGEIKKIAVEEYDLTKNKRPHPSVEIKLFDDITITDEKAALKWAVENDPSALKLDAKKLAKDAGSLELDFLDKKKEPRAQIATKLG
jgi:membrane-bound lytic murein transglycosylase MltF